MSETPRNTVRLPVCPFLPAPEEAMSWRSLHDFGPERGALFYVRCLEYAQFLWMRGSAARAILCLDRAQFADVASDASEMNVHPLPYRALVWMLLKVPETVFVGNPRVHFQHLADRVRAPRREQRRARAWACWQLTRLARPEFSGDVRHLVVEPALEETRADLAAHGVANEIAWWESACEDARRNR